MNKLKIALLGIGLVGLLPLQGCLAGAGSESESVDAEQFGVTACYTNSGINPTKAALAVAMARELRRWTPATDLATTTGVVGLSAAGQARCTAKPGRSSLGMCWALCANNSTDPDGDGWGWENNDSCIVVNSAPYKNNPACTTGCANTIAILGQQAAGMTKYVDQNVFNPTTFSQDLQTSINNQANVLANLQRNQPGNLPPSHKLIYIAGPTNLGKGACGPHYVFQVDDLNGSPLTTAEAANMANDLCFFGYGNCGSNPYLSFTVTGQGCPSGRTCVAIDPTDGDNGSTLTTTSGSAPTYPLNRFYDPANTQLNSPCVKTQGGTGTMQSKCSTYPSTCGYLYCI
jgi:hypothetical protein